MSDTPETDDIARGNHVVPTEWAQQLERERNEARDDADHWKIEYEIVVSRLCGVKHDRDNGVIFEHEIIPKLQRERDEAREEANKLLGAYEDATNYYARIIELKEELDEAREALVKILKNE